VLLDAADAPEGERLYLGRDRDVLVPRVR